MFTFIREVFTSSHKLVEEEANKDSDRTWLTPIEASRQEEDLKLEVEKNGLLSWVKLSTDGPVQDIDIVNRFINRLRGSFGEIKDDKVMSYDLRTNLQDSSFRVEVNYEEGKSHRYCIDGEEVPEDEFRYIVDRYTREIIPMDFKTRLQDLKSSNMFRPPFIRPDWLKSFSLTSDILKKEEIPDGVIHNGTRRSIYKREGLEVHGPLLNRHKVILMKDGKRIEALRFFEELDLLNLKP